MLKKTAFFTLALPLCAAMAQSERTNTRLANSIAAVVEDKIITVEDVRRELQPYLPQITEDAKGDAMAFRKLIEQAESEIIQNLTDNVLIVKQFFEDKGQIPASFIENEIEEIIITRFDGKRALYLNYLQSIGKTPEEHRETVRDDIIVNYMRSNMRKSASVVSPVKIERFYDENKQSFYQEEAVHLRIIRLPKIDENDDGSNNPTVQEILRRLELGYAFDEQAMRHSQDAKAKRGGDWGWVTRAALVEQLGNIAFSLEEGEYSEPVPMGNNLFILYAEDRRSEGYMPLPEVREDIEDMLVSHMAREAETRFLERLRRDGYVRRFN